MTENDLRSSRGTRRGLVEAEILNGAIRLFAERGFAGTSLQDISDAAGLTRPALYHYFANKEELLARLVAEVTMASVAELSEIAQQPDAADTRLRAMAFVVAHQQASRPERFQALLRSEADLPSPLAERYLEGRRLVLKEFVRVVEEGTAAGVFRPLEARTAALGVLGLCNWVAWWHHPSGEAADREVAGLLADMAVASLRPAVAARPVPPVTAVQALALLRQDVELLESMLALDDSS